MTQPEPGLRRKDGVAHFDGLNLAQLAERHATPCYVYSRDAIKTAYLAYARALGTRGKVCYAVKANPTHAILNSLAQLGAGFDIVSVGELHRVLDAGGEAADIIFSGVGKRDDEILTALKAGVGCFNIESQSELRRLSRLATNAGQTATIALRVNPAVDADTHRHIATGGEQHKFGIPYTSAAATATLSTTLPGIRLKGLAMHIGSQITDVNPIAEAARRLARLAAQLRETGIEIGHLDLGGGLGVGEFAPPINVYVSALSDAVGDRYSIALEPGRSIVAEAGILLTRVVCLKHNSSRSFAVVDAGMNDFLRPALYDAWHDVVVVDNRLKAPTASYDIVGPVCESADTLARQRRIALREGSLLAILSAGAYGSTMSSHYNSRPRCSEILVADGVATVIREPETLADLSRLEYKSNVQSS